MVTLVSPGVSVSVIDESFYASSGPGTIPLIFIATRSFKTIPGDPTSFAVGTLPENANKLFLITSQRELIQTFGEPVFVTSAGTPVHADERNEYGLLAAYQYLGIANRAYIIRSDINLQDLDPTPFEPRGNPISGTHWFDLTTTSWGIFRSNGQQNVVSFSDWILAQQVHAIDVIQKAEISLFGNVRFENSTMPAVTVNGSIVINGVSISIDSSDSLDIIVNKINSENIPNIEAHFDYNAKGVRIKVRNIAAGMLSLQGTTPTIASELGFTTLDADTTNFKPNMDLGVTGDFAVVTLNNVNRHYEKRLPTDQWGSIISNAEADWYWLGTDHWRETTPTIALGSVTSPSITGGQQLFVTVTFSNNVSVSTSINFASGWNVSNVVNQLQNDVNLNPYYMSGQLWIEEDVSGALRVVNMDGGLLTLSGSGAVLLGIDVNIKGKEVYFSPHTLIPSNSRAGEVWIKTTSPNSGAEYSVKVYNEDILQWVSISAPLFENDTEATAFYGQNVGAGVLYAEYDVYNNNTATTRLKRWDGQTWNILTYEASFVAPSTEAPAGTLWYNTQFIVDIMVGTGQTWVGMHNHPWYVNADVILSGSRPVQKDAGSPGAIASGSTSLVENDIWVDTSDLENYPKIYRWKTATNRWERIDNTDQTTPFGIVFADARWTTENGSQEQSDLITSNFVDPDAPNPLTYPNGMLLFNTRLSTFNVKQWIPGHLDEYTEVSLINADVIPPEYNVGLGVFAPITEDDAGRWVTISGNQYNGAPWMGRKAQRRMVVRALQSTVVSNEDIRAESVFFNLIASPGYVELIDEMVMLNVDKKETAFIIGDTPARLSPTGTSIQNWATNAANVPMNSEEGLLTSNTYVGMYYPWALSTNLDGFEVMVPPSHVLLRTIAFNDQVAYPWFAPAGFNRGIVTNAQSVGYLSAEGEYTPVILNQGQRDVIYLNNINPIAFMVGQGLVVYGQKSRHPIDSALDRINVVRLINYLRFNFDVIAKPYLFEPNDEQTREAVRITFERFLGDLITLRALYDFAVVCDESNNTPLRIDRNELWVDVAIKPVKAIEFIYIPIRVLGTGDDLPT